MTHLVEQVMGVPRIALIPQWVHRTLRRNGLKTEDLLQFERIRPLFSSDDLLGLMSLGASSQVFTGVDVRADVLGWAAHWIGTNANLSEASKKSILDLDSLAGLEQRKEDTLQRLFTEQPPRYEERVNETFAVDLLGDRHVAVTLFSGHALAEHASKQVELIRCLVKKLYVYEEYHRVISRDVGKAYIESLSR